MPWSITSATSSGGVSSMVCLIASTIESIDGSMASRIRALLGLGHTGWDRDDHARSREEERTLVHLADEVVEHLLGDVEVADDAVLQRTDGDDARGGSSDHSLGLGTNREDLTRALILGDDRRLGDHDAAPAHMHERVRRAEIDADVAGEHAEETIEQRWGYPFQTRSHVHAKDNVGARRNARVRVWVLESVLRAARTWRRATAEVSSRSQPRSFRWRSVVARRSRW